MGTSQESYASVLHHPNFQKILENTLWQKMEKALLPILDTHANAGAQFDLQDILQRFTFDSISKLVLDHDPGSVSMDLPNVPCLEALNGAVEAMLHRHILPESCWKLQKWLGVGIERKLSKAWDAVDQFIYPCIDEQSWFVTIQYLSMTEQNGQTSSCSVF